ncbi:MAG: hypothetical protein ABEJ31_06405 [Haloarculaceae archaeon]
MVREALLTYGVPFVGAVLLAIGLASGVVGGYTLFQSSAGLCGTPKIQVDSPSDTQRLLAGHGAGPGPTLSSIAYENLSDGEQRAFREALDAVNREGGIDGTFPHRAAFQRGVLVTYRGEQYYTTVVTSDNCVKPAPLLLPLGITSIVLGIAGVLTPPLYRRYVAFERRQRRP